MPIPVQDGDPKIGLTEWNEMVGVLNDAEVAARSSGQLRSLLGSQFAFFGDSITGYEQRYPFFASIASKQRINYDVDRLFSYAGYTSGQLTAQTAEVTALDPTPHAVVVHAGANDAQLLTPLATFQANMRSIISDFRAAGIPVVVGGVLPLSQENARPLVRQYNAWLRYYCSAEGLTFVDFYPHMVDRATGAPLASMIAGDGIHPTPLGQKTMGTLVAEALDQVLPPISPLLTADGQDGTNLIVNGLALTDSNSDGIPDGWGGQGDGTGWTSSLVDDDEAVGRWMRLVGSGTVGQRTYEATAITSGFAPGDELLVSCRVRTSNLTEADSQLWVQVLMYDADGGGLGAAYLFSGQSSAIDGVAAVRISVPATAARLVPYYQAGPGDGTYEIADVTAVNLTALGIA